VTAVSRASSLSQRKEKEKENKIPIKLENKRKEKEKLFMSEASHNSGLEVEVWWISNRT